jgi:hypothetical protein
MTLDVNAGMTVLVSKTVSEDGASMAPSEPSPFRSAGIVQLACSATLVLRDWLQQLP